MMLTDEQYERIARHLDGEEVALSAPERAVAAEIRGDERRLSSRLDASIPPDAAAHLARPALLAVMRPPSGACWTPTCRAKRSCACTGVCWRPWPARGGG